MICASVLLLRCRTGELPVVCGTVRRRGVLGGEVTATVSGDRLGEARQGGWASQAVDPHRAFIHARISQAPHLTQHGLKDELAARGVCVSHNAV